MRFAAGIEYNGTRYCGWQTQPEGCAVQDALERGLSRVANHTVTTQCAGRTDAGVHATAQVVHFDSTAQRSRRQWLLGANSSLPRDINVAWVTPVDPEFHARFSALERRYRYVILNRGYRSALLEDRVHFEPRELDVDIMHRAAQQLVGEHDFSAFRAAGCQASSPVRTVRFLRVQRYGDFITVDVAANAFLQNMVRIITGVLMRTGRGEAEPDWVAEVLRDRDRKHRGITAPACGLYFTAVDYPSHFDLPSPRHEYPVFPFVA